jgi:hypothetical protein
MENPSLFTNVRSTGSKIAANVWRSMTWQRCGGGRGVKWPSSFTIATSSSVTRVLASILEDVSARDSVYSTLVTVRMIVGRDRVRQNEPTMGATRGPFKTGKFPGGRSGAIQLGCPPRRWTPVVGRSPRTTALLAPWASETMTGMPPMDGGSPSRPAARSSAKKAALPMRHRTTIPSCSRT